MFLKLIKDNWGGGVITYIFYPRSASKMKFSRSLSITISKKLIDISIIVHMIIFIIIILGYENIEAWDFIYIGACDIIYIISNVNKLRR